LGEELSNYKPGFHDVVNIGGGNPVSLVNMIETLEEILDKKIRIKKFEHNINDVNFTNANTGYLESLVGSKPTIKLKEGLTEVAEWASNLPNINELKIWSESVS
jgi:UDP-glucuronate 4-epimerase